MASSPNSSLNGGNSCGPSLSCPNGHKILESSSTHSPLANPTILRFRPERIFLLARSMSPLDCGWRTAAKHNLMPSSSQNSLNVSASNWVPLSIVSCLGTSNLHIIFCEKIFCTFLEVIASQGFCFDPLRKIFNCYHCKLQAAFCHWKWADEIHAPPSHWQNWGNILKCYWRTVASSSHPLHPWQVRTNSSTSLTIVSQ
ncbi:hypothetical protein GUJ93_ZPchr0012g18924 [Zizania palustris]|uniref:Uncharacterized protein n=1 Tax=Zizania palustris TaxID=103762 RepID=A0A8J5WY06_ZIZPA|nr:hypothetical protein GUJ93_ZPchr0012g18924 [Zizania palustris]